MSCNRQTEIDNMFNKYTILSENLPAKIKLNSFDDFKLVDDFEYPKHSYILLTGDSIDLVAFINKIGLLPFTKNNFEINSSSKLHEYNGQSLWEIEGYSVQQRDKDIQTKLGIKNIKYADYAAYYNSGLNKIFITAENNWNGKIVAIIKNNICIIFIEELKDPQFKRNDDIK